MANHFSALKRIRQTETKTAINRSNTSRMRTALRKLRETITGGDAAAANKELSVAYSILDKSVKKGILHKNTASRYKKRLNARVKALAVAAK